MSILLLDNLARASKDPATVDPELLPVMLSFLDDCLGSGLQSITTSLAMATSLRRSLILDQLYWPSQCSFREQMEKLPLLGSDLFANKFDDTTCMLQEAKLLKTDG